MRIIRVDRSGGNFTIVPNQTVRNRELSFGARGLLLHLLSFRDGWEVQIGDLFRESPGGRDATRKLLAELEAARHLFKFRSVDQRRRIVWNHYVLDVALPEGFPEDEAALRALAEGGSAAVISGMRSGRKAAAPSTGFQHMEIQHMAGQVTADQSLPSQEADSQGTGGQMTGHQALVAHDAVFQDADPQSVASQDTTGQLLVGQRRETDPLKEDAPSKTSQKIPLPPPPSGRDGTGGDPVRHAPEEVNLDTNLDTGTSTTSAPDAADAEDVEDAGVTEALGRQGSASFPGMDALFDVAAGIADAVTDPGPLTDDNRGGTGGAADVTDSDAHDAGGEESAGGGAGSDDDDQLDEPGAVVEVGDDALGVAVPFRPRVAMTLDLVRMAIEHLPQPLAPRSNKQRRQMEELFGPYLDSGWPVDAVVKAAVVSLPEHVNNPPRFIQQRLAGLGAAPQTSRAQAWCGQCDKTSRLVYDESVDPVAVAWCPRCSRIGAGTTSGSTSGSGESAAAS